MECLIRDQIEVKTFFLEITMNLETKINKNGLKVPRFLMSFKTVPQTEKG